MAHISKEQTVQYILTLIDDTLQVQSKMLPVWTNSSCFHSFCVAQSFGYVNNLLNNTIHIIDKHRNAVAKSVIFDYT